MRSNDPNHRSWVPHRLPERSATFATTGVPNDTPSPLATNLEQKLIVVMAAIVTSHKLVAIGDTIDRNRRSPLHRRGANHEIRQ